MINSKEAISVISVMQEEMNVNMEQTKEIVIAPALFVHGYADTIADNTSLFCARIESKRLMIT